MLFSQVKVSKKIESSREILGLALKFTVFFHQNRKIYCNINAYRKIFATVIDFSNTFILYIYIYIYSHTTVCPVFTPPMTPKIPHAPRALSRKPLFASPSRNSREKTAAWEVMDFLLAFIFRSINRLIINTDCVA